MQINWILIIFLIMELKECIGGIRRYQNPDGSYTSAGKAKRKISGKIKLSDDQKTLVKVMAGSALAAGVATAIGTTYVANKDADKYLGILTGPVANRTISNMRTKVYVYEAMLHHKDALSSIDIGTLKKMRDGIDRDTKTAKEEANVSREAYDHLRNNTSIKLAMKVSKKTRDKMERARQSVADIDAASNMMSLYGGTLKQKINEVLD